MILRTAIVASVAGLATAASASIFSFASDNDHTSYTFAGFGSSVTDGMDPGDVFELLIDDDNGSNNPLSFEVEFGASFDLAYVGSTDLGNGLFIHSYSLSGEFGFFDGNDAVLTADIASGALTAFGTANSWLSTSTVLSADGDADNLVYTWHGDDIPDYGLYTGDSVGVDDAAFTLTYLQSSSGSGVNLDSGMLPEDEWQSEGSYSGSATFVPTPGSLALLGLGSLAVGRRRR